MASRKPAAGGSPAGNQGGFTFLELVAVVVIVAILFLTALYKFAELKVDAEKAAMEQVLGGLRSAVGMQMVGHILSGELTKIVQMAGANPMESLSERPHNYRGEFDAPDPAAMEPGTWYFHRGDGTLCYRVRSESYFQSDLAGAERACFRNQLLFDDLNGDGNYQAEKDKITGLVVTPVRPYRWLKSAEGN
jgi:general secretion pathway protein G